MIYRKDLVLTGTFLVKGHVNTGGQRLSNFLNNTPKRFLEMDEATVIHLLQGERTKKARILVRVDEILLAHELEETGDETLRLLAEREKDEITATVLFNGTTRLEVSGRVGKRALERDGGDHDFIVVMGPEIRGLTGEAGMEFSVLDDLHYLIANKSRIVLVAQ
jgi:hypothetical protein